MRDATRQRVYDAEQRWTLREGAAGVLKMVDGYEAQTWVNDFYQRHRLGQPPTVTLKIGKGWAIAKASGYTNKIWVHRRWVEAWVLVHEIAHVEADKQAQGLQIGDPRHGPLFLDWFVLLVDAEWGEGQALKHQFEQKGLQVGVRAEVNRQAAAKMAREKRRDKEGEVRMGWVLVRGQDDLAYRHSRNRWTRSKYRAAVALRKSTVERWIEKERWSAGWQPMEVTVEFYNGKWEVK